MSTIILSHFPRKDKRMEEPNWESLPIVIIAIAGIIAAVLIYNNIQSIITAEELPEVHATPIYIVEEPSGGHETVEVETVEEVSEVEELPTRPSKPVLSDEELIAQVVHAEANGEPMIGRVAVACVVLNRCDYYGLTVESVVYAKNQFAIADSYSKDDLRAVEIAMDNRDLFSDRMLYFRNKHFHTFGEEYLVIGNHYFSLAKEKEE